MHFGYTLQVNRRVVEMDQVEKVIVWDVRNELTGMLVTPNQSLHAEEMHKRIVTLPSDARLFALSGLSVFIRPWGQGIAFNDMQVRRGAPMVVYVTPDLSYLHWAARIEKIDKAKPVRGTITLAGNADPVIQCAGVLSALNKPVDVNQLGEPDEKNGWIIKGKAAFRTMQDGLCPVVFQAVADNIKIRWSAITQSRADE